MVWCLLEGNAYLRLDAYKWKFNKGHVTYSFYLSGNIDCILVPYAF